MGLKATRRLLSIILCVVLSFSTMCCLASSVMSITLGSQRFLEKRLISDEVVEECNNQLSLKFKALEAESGIPARVFEADNTSGEIRERLELSLENAFSGGSSEPDDMEEYFYDLCVEYLNGNSISYNRENVRRVSKRASEIYSQTVEIQSLETIKERLYSLNRGCAKACSLSALGIAVCIGLFFVLYGERKFAYSYISGGVAGGGIACLLGAIACIASGAGAGLSINPEAYQSSSASMINIYFVTLAVVGALLCAGGIFACGKIEKHNKK